MILIPLPAIVALLLGFVLCLVALKRERRFRPIIVFLAVSTALMTVVSLRWSFDTAGFPLPPARVRRTPAGNGVALLCGP
ncbi:hypothetical protein [uncultured Nitratireductor sp.]|uniref:hypothetical protein n=1 Tax=uncultured Nitratireductor sp. TaxID=520953 RepID=UPI00261438A4|nr:hypothetical protein [uncultured Nitratireductor sp.]